MIIDIPHGIYRDDQKSNKDAFSVFASYNTETQEVSEVVNLAHPVSEDDSISLTALIAQLQELQDRYGDQFNEGITFETDADYDHMEQTLLGRRTMRPGDPFYPDSLTPGLDMIYPDRTWTRVGADAVPETDTRGVMVLNGVADEMDVENYLQRTRMWTLEDQLSSYQDTAWRIVSTEREVSKLAGAQNPNNSVRFAHHKTEPLVVAQVYNNSSSISSWWVSEIPEVAEGAAERLMWFRHSVGDHKKRTAKSVLA